VLGADAVAGALAAEALPRGGAASMSVTGFARVAAALARSGSLSAWEARAIDADGATEADGTSNTGGATNTDADGEAV